MVMPRTTTALVGGHSKRRRLAGRAEHNMRGASGTHGQDLWPFLRIVECRMLLFLGEVPQFPRAMGWHKQNEDTVQLPPFAQSF